MKSLIAAVLLTTLAHAQVPHFSRVFIVVEENRSYSQVIGASAMPYLNSLVKKYGLAADYYANTHPSIGNYFMLTVGQIITNDDYYSGTVTVDNVVRHLLTAGNTWKAYEESLPSVGYIKPDVGTYARRHCPLSYLSDVVNSSAQKLNLVPFTQFATDLANGVLPDYSFITPNLCHDAHGLDGVCSGSLAVADQWLKTNLDPLIQSADFQAGGLLIITFDESISTDTAHGGGHIAWVAISPQFSKTGFRSTTFYQHQSTLQLMLQGLGLTSFPGKAASAPSMGEFFH